MTKFIMDFFSLLAIDCDERMLFIGWENTNGLDDFGEYCVYDEKMVCPAWGVPVERLNVPIGCVHSNRFSGLTAPEPASTICALSVIPVRFLIPHLKRSSLCVRFQ